MSCAAVQNRPLKESLNVTRMSVSGLVAFPMDEHSQHPSTFALGMYNPNVSLLPAGRRVLSAAVSERITEGGF